MQLYVNVLWQNDDDDNDINISILEPLSFTWVFLVLVK